MLFKVGDKVIFKKEKQSGIITKINSLYKVQIETPEGFEINVSVKDIILIDSLTDNPSAYGTGFYQKDLQKNKKPSYKQQRSQTILKVDLHIELLSSHYQYMDNFEIVQLQLKECQEKLEYALNSKITKVVIVHGIGTGVLKKEVHQLLQNYKLRYYLSKDGGVTEVIF